MSTLLKLRDQLLTLVFKLSWNAQRAVKLADNYLQLSDTVPHGIGSDDDDTEPDLIPEANDTVPQESCSQVQHVPALHAVLALPTCVRYRTHATI